jgi:hypothetical protein
LSGQRFISEPIGSDENIGQIRKCPCIITDLKPGKTETFVVRFNDAVSYLIYEFYKRQ